MDNLKNLGRPKSKDEIHQELRDVSGILKWSLRSAQNLVEHFVSDPMLIAILCGQAGDHGMPPSQVPAFLHVGIAQHYFKGAYYPLGGGFVIPRAFVRALKRAGGEIRLETRVERILLKDGKAIGIRLEDGEEIGASKLSKLPVSWPHAHCLCRSIPL